MIHRRHPTSLHLQLPQHLQHPGIGKAVRRFGLEQVDRLAQRGQRDT